MRTVRVRIIVEDVALQPRFSPAERKFDIFVPDPQSNETLAGELDVILWTVIQKHGFTIEEPK